MVQLREEQASGAYAAGYSERPTGRTRAEQLAPAAGRAPAGSAAMPGDQKNRAAAVQSYGGYAAPQQSRAARIVAENGGEHPATSTQAKEGMSSAGCAPARAAVMQNRTDVQSFRQPGRTPAPARAAATYGGYQARVATQGEQMQAALKQAPRGEATTSDDQVVNHVGQQHEGQSNHMYRQSRQTGDRRVMYQQ